ncbi:hypothetical protein [uncultured Dokdonia sp.]|uniref:hypothetical protein n=1 Tax=uncultured Dokdonia sp. TaxID=575653 RepID=UPI0026165AFF|nr:hypothetical protein [uncultured Dokdonia sp.]
MTKQHSVFTLLFLLGISFFISCTNDNDENLELTIEEQNISIEEGILRFPSEDIFIETLENLRTLSHEELKGWIQDLNFSNSHFLVQEYYAQLPTDEDVFLHDKLNKASILYIPDPVFSAILNKEGIYKIAQKYHRITQDKEYISEDYSAVIEPNASIKSNSLQVFDIKSSSETNAQRVNLNGQTLCAKYTQNNHVGTGFYGGNYFNKFVPYPSNYSNCSGGDYSFHTQTWYTQFSNFFSVGTWIKGRKYKKGGAFGRKKWRDDNMSYAKINNSAVTNRTIYTLYFNQNFTPGPVIQTFNINYEYNDENRGLRKVAMTLQSTQ